MTVDVDIDVVADMDVDMAADMDVDVEDVMDADSPCFHGAVSSGPNIFGLIIISIQPIFRIQFILALCPF
jgi:hypothetical protein